MQEPRLPHRHTKHNGTTPKQERVRIASCMCNDKGGSLVLTQDTMPGLNQTLFQVDSVIVVSRVRNLLYLKGENELLWQSPAVRRRKRFTTNIPHNR